MSKSRGVDVYSIDFGSLNTLVTFLGSDNKIEVCINPAQKRLSPTLFVKNSEARFFGCLAQSALSGNEENAIDNLKYFIGKEYSDKIQKNSNVKLYSDKGLTGFEIMGKKYTMEEILAFIIKELHSFIPNKDCNETVFVVPTFWSNRERQVIRDSIKLAGYNCYKLINTSVAQAADYMLRSPPEKKSIAAFVDCGHTSFTFSILKLYPTEKKKLKLLGYRHFGRGGKNFTNKLETVIFRKLIEDGKYTKETKDSIKKDITLHKRFIDSVQKTKESFAVSKTAIFEFIGNEPNQDVKKYQLLIEDFEEVTQKYISSYVEKAKECIEEVKKDYSLGDKFIDIFEIHGGCGRVVKVRESLKELVDKYSNAEPGTDVLTQKLNAEECFTEGGAFAAAHLKIEQSDFDDNGMCTEGKYYPKSDEEIKRLKGEMEKEKEQEEEMAGWDDAHQGLQEFMFDIKNRIRKNVANAKSQHVTQVFIDLQEECEKVYESTGGAHCTPFYQALRKAWDEWLDPLTRVELCYSEGLEYFNDYKNYKHYASLLESGIKGLTNAKNPALAVADVLSAANQKLSANSNFGNILRGNNLIDEQSQEVLLQHYTFMEEERNEVLDAVQKAIKGEKIVQPVSGSELYAALGEYKPQVGPQ